MSATCRAARTSVKQVSAIYSESSAPPEAVRVEAGDGVENIVLQLSGDPAEMIVVGAHYDFVDRGCGAVDNWSGIVALAHLYRSIRALPSRKTVQFVAFGQEEQGLLGSKAMVRAIPQDQLSHYCAMINIDSFGLALPIAMENTAMPIETKQA